MDSQIELDVIKAQQGDKEAFCRLIKEIEPNLYRIASSIMRSEDECLDAAQEAVIKAYLSIEQLKQPQFFKTWITRILIRECTRLLKNRNKIIPMNTIDILESQNESNLEDNFELKEAISKLEKDYRIVITLFYIQDLSVKEISEIIEQPEGTVKSRLSRARKKLAQLLEDNIQVGGIRYEQI
ncbi:sigma-70 family RNA polymerase sigma factor [Bacillus luteolus]|uniref:Sigma-70 family RNA polymerase sigma factor n=1 Tax=Litchfieldia luteola TaxID=682179 RepID=A0ABR9QL46_9BACI|nr:sigma-70 family RNA polymerase sigma factor [Cytobacillus luteolus]MBE4909225.1 sigma-70 family RNA polymerase sigma factor [Cytobacillus luteolus]MBP1940318.1 RNA polymerase sigma-70 factor (ECF subfamily) [Cytobacillus luteolus]